MRSQSLAGGCTDGTAAPAGAQGAVMRGPAVPSHPGRLMAWCAAARPWSLPISVVPVAIGLAMIWRDTGTIDPRVAAATVLASVLIHLGTNLQNDVSDGRRGADGAGRTGPPRATAQGWLTARTVQGWALAMFVLATVPGAWLAMIGGWPIVVTGLAAIIAGAAYTAGPWPTGYHGLGEACVLVFFGPVAVAGAYYLGTARFSTEAALAGLLPGSLACAVLIANNLRDCVSDARAGKRTLAVRFGVRFTLFEYRLAVLAPYPVALALAMQHHVQVLVVWMTLPLAMSLALAIARAGSAAALNAVLARTNRLLAVAGSLLAILMATSPGVQ